MLTAGQVADPAMPWISAICPSRRCGRTAPPTPAPPRPHGGIAEGLPRDRNGERAQQHGAGKARGGGRPRRNMAAVMAMRPLSPVPAASAIWRRRSTARETATLWRGRGWSCRAPSGRTPPAPAARGCLVAQHGEDKRDGRWSRHQRRPISGSAHRSAPEFRPPRRSSRPPSCARSSAHWLASVGAAAVPGGGRRLRHALAGRRLRP